MKGKSQSFLQAGRVSTMQSDVEAMTDELSLKSSAVKHTQSNTLKTKNQADGQMVSVSSKAKELKKECLSGS